MFRMVGHPIVFPPRFKKIVTHGMALNMPSHTMMIIFFLLIVRILSPGYMSCRGGELAEHRDLLLIAP